MHVCVNCTRTMYRYMYLFVKLSTILHNSHNLKSIGRMCFIHWFVFACFQQLFRSQQQQQQQQAAAAAALSAAAAANTPAQLQLLQQQQYLQQQQLAAAAAGLAPTTFATAPPTPYIINPQEPYVIAGKYARTAFIRFRILNSEQRAVVNFHVCSSSDCAR